MKIKLMGMMLAASLAMAAAVPAFAESQEAVDISESLIGLWEDEAGDIYGFYGDNSFFAQWVEDDTEVVGIYSLATDGENTVLAMELDDERQVTYTMEADEEANQLVFYNEETGSTSYLYPYNNEDDPYNAVYQYIGQTITDAYYGTTDAGEVFSFASNDDGSFCLVMALSEDGSEYVSFLGAGTKNEDGTITVEDQTSNLTLTFGVTANDDGSYNLDMGDTGSADVEEAYIADVIDLLVYCTKYATPVA